MYSGSEQATLLVVTASGCAHPIRGIQLSVVRLAYHCTVQAVSPGGYQIRSWAVMDGERAGGSVLVALASDSVACVRHR